MANLFLNPGFETGGIWPDDWTVTEAGASILTMDPDNIHSGEFGVRMDIDSGNNPVNFYQDVTLLPSTHYYLSLWRNHSLAGKTLKVMVRDSGSHIWLTSDGSWATSATWITIANVQEWIQWMIDFFSDPAYTDYRITVQSDSAASSSISIDDLYLDTSPDVSAGGYPPSDVALIDEECKFLYLHPFLVWMPAMDSPEFFELRTENANWGQKTDKFIAWVPGTATMFEWSDYESWADQQGLSEIERRTVTIYIKARDTAGVYSLNADSIMLVNTAPDASDVILTLTNRTNAITVNFWKADYEPDLKTWEIYRNTVNNSAGATKIGAQSVWSTTFYDTNIIAGVTYYYWVKCLNTAGASSDFSAVASITHALLSQPITFEQTDEAAFPAVDGTFGFTAALILLHNCDSEMDFRTDSAVPGSVVINWEGADIKEGIGAIKVSLFRYPKVEYFEDGSTDLVLCNASHRYTTQGFKVSSPTNVKAIGLELRRTGTPADLNVKIYNADFTSLLGTAVIPASSVDNSYGVPPKNYIYAVFSTPVSLSAGVQYQMLLENGAGSSSNYYRCKYTLIGGYPNGNMRYGTIFPPESSTTGDLNFRICVQGDALNQYVYAILAATKNISAKTRIKNWIKASRTGTFLSQSFGEAAIGERNFPINMDAANAWLWKENDISGVPAANRDAVQYVGWKITDMSEDVILYLDYLITDGTSEFKAYLGGALKSVILGDYVIAASDNLINSADTERSQLGLTYVKVKEFRINKNGTYRVNFDLKSSSGTYNGRGQIYKNGVGFGTIQTQSGTTYVTKTEDLAFAAGDTCELWIDSNNAGATGYVRNFRLYGNKIVSGTPDNASVSVN